MVLINPRGKSSFLSRKKIEFFVVSFCILLIAIASLNNKYVSEKNTNKELLSTISTYEQELTELREEVETWANKYNEKTQAVSAIETKFNGLKNSLDNLTTLGGKK